MFSRHPDTLKDASGSGEQERKKKRRSLRLGFGMDVEEESQVNSMRGGRGEMDTQRDREIHIVACGSSAVES